MWNFWVCKKQKTRRNCCHCLLVSSWYSRYECPITPKWGGHYICGIHQPPKTNVDCTHSNFGMAIMPLPPWSTRHYLQACHESFQDASSKHWWSIVQFLKRLVLCMGSCRVVQFPNTIILSVGLEMMIPQTNNLKKIKFRVHKTSWIQHIWRHNWHNWQGLLKP